MHKLVTLVTAIALTVGLAPARALAPGAHLEGAESRGVIVHLAPGADMEAVAREVHREGFAAGSRYPAIDAFVAYGPLSALRDLKTTDGVVYVEPDIPLQYATETSHIATRGKTVLTGEVALPDGTRIDGASVGVAVVDSGVDATHPDLADRLVQNLRVVCSVVRVGPITDCRYVPLPDTDHVAVSGHGTHVSGIVAGTGQASGGRFHGAAPRAGLYGLGAGATIYLTEVLGAFGWILKNHDKVNPPIRVVNNSWGGATSKPSPDQPGAIGKFQKELLDAGITLVFSAMNYGGNGSEQQTSSECVWLQPGNICVANYDDGETGSRDGTLHSSSSRGAANDPETWPDLSAPGSRITASCRLTLPVCWFGFSHETAPPNHYAALYGTSMAAPHVAGIVAQLYQVDPLLTPAQVEGILEETAHKFSYGAPYQADPMHPEGTSSYDKGHGLVDARAAVEAALNPLVVSSPQSGSTNSGSVEVAGRIWYGDTVEIAVDGQSVATIETVSRLWSHTLPGLQPGQRVVTVTLYSNGRTVGSVERIVTVS